MSRRWRWSAMLAPVALAGVLGCGDLGDEPEGGGPLEPPPSTVSFAADIQPVFDAACVGCHGAGGNAGLDLRPGASHGNLVDVAATESSLDRVEPGQPHQSWLFLKLTGQQTVGTEMPPGGSIGDAAIALVRTWIEEGAADN